MDLADHHCTLFAGVRDDHAKRLFDGATDDRSTDLLIAFQRLDEGIDDGSAANQGNTAARDDTFLDSRARCMHRIFHACLLFLHLGLGSSTNLDHCNAANQLGEALLQLLTVVVRGGLLDLRANLLYAARDVIVRTAAIDDGGVVLVDRHALRGAQILNLDALELDAEVFGDRLAAGQDSDVLQHRLAAIAKAGSLDGSDVQACHAAC